MQYAKVVGVHGTLDTHAYMPPCKIDWTEFARFASNTSHRQSDRLEFGAVLECSICPFQPSPANGEAWNGSVNALLGDCWVAHLGREFHVGRLESVQHCDYACIGQVN